MYQFPEWSDLGKTSQVSRGMWEEMQARIQEYRAYYTGEVFSEKVPTDEPTADAPLMYPAGMNIIKMIQAKGLRRRGMDVRAGRIVRSVGAAVVIVCALFAAPDKFADTRLCISFARAGIATTGSLLLELADPQERSATALPLIHAVFVKGSTIAPDLYALHELIARELAAAKTAYLSITTGPSRTADIERVLTIGVHGPRKVVAVLLSGG